jgi:class 3 adenylate cyclase/tetratricopeptide (TPR) repeat protein
LENPEGFSFCGKCGTKLESTPVREERKVITALFCDLVGSTALGERLDSEDISRLLRSYQAICRARIESHGGVVEKFIGDAVVGVFGVPLAHEDDPERAVRAALRIIEDIGASDLGIEVRIGVNTGEALVRLDVDPRSGEGFATGDTMNTAARLEAAAPVMGVAVGAATYGASAEAIVYEELAPITAKGKAEPVHAWRALHPTARVGTEERDRTPFVGRDLELSMLTQLFERSRSRPATEFVTIIAEPGLGKSRLVRELARHVDRLPEFITWREGRCLPYGDGISFWALGEIVKAQAGILETDDQATVSAKLEGVISEPDPQTRDWIKDRLAPLVGLETTTEPPQRDEVFTAWRRFLEEIAGAGPTVLVIEDLHWADAAFVAFLEHLAERTAGLPLLVVVTARPEVEERYPSWPPGRRSTVLSLSPLADEDLESLITQSLPEADPELIRIVVERAGGSPLYAEQLSAMLRERALPIAGGALDETMIPQSVQALIAARIDALPREPKRVLMEASVVGKTFWSGAISALGEHEDVEATLGELVRREFCRPVHPSTMEGDSEFGFWHALVRDVAYAELTKAERARMHAATAQWIADRTSGAMGEDAEIVVHHLDAALELAPSALELDIEELTELLVDALIAAGEAAMRTEVAKAGTVFARALDLLPPDDHRRLGALIQRGRSHQAAGQFEEAVSAFRDALDVGIETADVEASTDAAIGLDIVLDVIGDPEGALIAVAEARRGLGEDPSPALTRMLAQEAMTFVTDGRPTEAVRRADEALEGAHAIGLPPPSRALMARGIARFDLGDPGGEEDLRLAYDLAMADGDLRSAIVTLMNLAGCLSEQGPIQLSIDDDHIALSDRYGFEAEMWAGRAGRLELLLLLGQLDELMAEAEPVLVWAREHGDAWSRSKVLACVAAVEVLRGEAKVDPAELRELAHAFRRFGCELLPRAARLASTAGDVESARSLLAELEEMVPVDEVGNSSEVVRACVEARVPRLGERLLAKGTRRVPLEEASRQGAEAMLAEAKEEFELARERYLAVLARWRELGVVLEQAYTLAGIGRCLLALGESEDGTIRLREARALWVDMKATRPIAEIDELIKTLD